MKSNSQNKWLSKINQRIKARMKVLYLKNIMQRHKGIIRNPIAVIFIRNP